MTDPIPPVQHDAPRIIVLLLEDSAFDRDLTLARLERDGLDIALHHAVTKEQFLSLLAERAYDVILADYDVPGFSGLAALEIVRAQDQQIPFIFISGVVGEEVAIDTLHRGATDYVLKQRLDRLAPAVRRAVKESHEHKTRLEAEARAHSNEERFQHLTNALTQLVWTLDEAGNVTYANAAWHKTFPAMEQTWHGPDVMHEETIVACKDAWDRARAQRAGFSCEARFWRQDVKAHHWFLVKAVPFSSIGEELEWLFTATDVQEEREREEALRTAEKLAVTGRLAATIAHEINNPLESLTNLMYLLKQDTGLSSSARHYANMADYELQRVSAIAKQTLAFYRDNTTPSVFDGNEVVADVMSLFASRFRTKEIATTIQCPDPCLIRATRGDLRQVLINLVSNAVDATPRSGTVQIITRSKVPSRDTVVSEIVIENSGSPIAPHHQDRLFTPFFSTKGEHGTGLGLWVSKGIVEKHRGAISIRSYTLADGDHRTAARITFPSSSPKERDEA